MSEEVEEYKKPQSKAKWSEDGMIWYDEDGEGWALNKKGKRVCICKDFDKVLSGEVPLEACSNPQQKEALEIIINFRREQEENGQRQITTTRKGANNKRRGTTQRTRLMSRSKHHGSNTRHFAQRKRLPMH